MYEQQQQQQQPQQVRMDVRKKGGHVRRSSITEEERLEIVDLSGMSLDALPNPSLNLGTICKLDLSNNNLQVNFQLFCMYVLQYLHTLRDIYRSLSWNINLVMDFSFLPTRYMVEC